jgi:effector-binding domain-containing protein
VAHTITTLLVAARPTAVIAAATPWPEFPSLWKKLLDEVHASVRWGGGGHKGRNVMLYLDGVPNVEVGVELDQPVEIEGPRVVRSTLPAGEVAMTVHRGSYAGLGEAHDAVGRWFGERGITPAGPRWEVYGHHYDDPALIETEIFYLL